MNVTVPNPAPTTCYRMESHRLADLIRKTSRRKTRVQVQEKISQVSIPYVCKDTRTYVCVQSNRGVIAPTPPHPMCIKCTRLHARFFHPADTNLTVLQLTEMFEKQRPELTRILAACLKTTCPSVRWVSSR